MVLTRLLPFFLTFILCLPGLASGYSGGGGGGTTNADDIDSGTLAVARGGTGSGNRALDSQTVTTDTTLTSSSATFIIGVPPINTAITVTLPDVTTCTGKRFVIVNTGTGFQVDVVCAGSDKIGKGTSTFSSVSLNQYYCASREFISTGTYWYAPLGWSGSCTPWDNGGGVLCTYNNGSYGVNPSGTTGQVLLSAGQNPPTWGTLTRSYGGTGLTTSGTDSTKALMSDGANGFVMATPGGASPLPAGFLGDGWRRSCFAQPRYATAAWVSNEGSTPASAGATAPSTGTTVSGYLVAPFTTTGSNGNSVGVDSADNGPFQYANKPTQSQVIVTGSDITNQRIWACSVADSPGAMYNLTTPGSSGRHGWGFRYEAGTDTNWKFLTFNGSSETVTDTGIAVAANTVYKFSVDATNASQIVGYINGSSVATNSATLPTSTVYLPWLCFFTNTSAASHTCYFGKILYEAQ